MLTYEMLHVQQLTKHYGIKPVLEDITLTLNRGDRAALVGENGAGKTTLARLIAGQETPDRGLMRTAPGSTMGYLPQEITLPPDHSIGQYLAQAAGSLAALHTQMQALAQQMAQPQPDDVLATLLARYGDLQTRLEAGGGYDLENRTAAIFAGLQIGYLRHEQPFSRLSGGEKTRVALAALLLAPPDLLLLDEPTNHLDAAGIAWLETWLTTYPGTLLLITHDRVFMDRVATHILELSPVTRRLKTYYGRYADYLAQREAEYTQALDAYIGQVSAISSLKRSVKMQTHNPKAAPPPPDGDKLLYNARRANAQDTRRRTIRDARQRLATLEDTLPENPAHRWTIRFEFDPLPLTSAEPLRFTGLTKRYGGRVLFENLSGVLRRGERAVLVAPNGTGKTTLLRLLAGHITPDAGHIALSSSAKTGYLDQEGETQDGTQPVLAAYRAAALTPAADRDLLAELHRSGLFTDASLPQKRIADLSQGQRRKLGLACLLAARASVLLLDEPTNHLDPLSLEALEAALRHFPGALLAVSHDRRFIDRVATHLWELRDGQLYVQAVAP